MWLDAALSYLHFAAIFLVFAFLTVEAVLLRRAIDADAARLLVRVDIWFFASAMAALATGFLRLGFGAKGAEFYLSSWPIYAKLGLFVAVALISIRPTLTFIGWRRSFQQDPGWRLPDEDRAAVRRLVMIEVHVAALIPAVAVVMARGLG